MEKQGEHGNPELVESIMKKVLLIAYHYPPVSVSSGLQRTLKFSQYLRDFSWEPSVLSINPLAYEKQSNGQLAEVPDDIVVKRALGFDAARHLSFKGKYLSVLAYPDRWISWWPMGVLSGLWLLWTQKVDVIFSTYPIATSHLIGLVLHKITGKPWIADFRDSMTEDNYPIEPKKRKIYQWIEKKTVKSCIKAIFTTPGALKMYSERYPQYSSDKWAVIENAFDEGNFEQAVVVEKTLIKPKGVIRLVHSGVLYPSERDPTDFFDALSELKIEGSIVAGSLKILLRATGHDDLFDPMIKERNIDDIVSLEPNVPYVDALQEMLDVEGLLVFQASNCNHQIPAKVYEYLRAEKPILALTDEKGDTANVLKKEEVGYILPLDDKEAIKRGLIEFIQQIKNNTASRPDKTIWKQHMRYARTEQLAKLLDDVVS
jgi:hypothetical protein